MSIQDRLGENPEVGESPEDVFDALWRRSLDSGNVLPKSFRWRLYHILNFPYNIFSKQRLLLNIVKGEIIAMYGQLKDLRILEPGFGTGVISTRLSSCGSDVHFLDISDNALKLIKKIPSYNSRKLIRASMFEMPFVDEAFDVVWNEGVLEHFSEEQQISALKEYTRVLKRGGLMVLIVPKEGAPFYQAGARRAQEAGIWRYGYEKPMSTLKNLAERVEDLRIVKEYSCGFLIETQFLGYFLAAAGRWRLKLVYDLLNGWLNMLLWPLNKLPGNLLISVLRKEQDSEKCL